MLCDHCGENEAVIHLTQIVDNQMSTFHLCEACAEEKGLEPGVNAGNFPLTDFLAQIGKGIGAEGGAAVGACAYCGLKLEDFKKTGRLGCPHCYVTFEVHLRSLLRRLHGGTQHVGKVYLPPDPTQAQRQQRLSGLRRKLDKAVASEDFERAAELRDQIRALEAAT
ncbi:MAG TPA: UvrB/UvrC motif-containing protein [Longimicrobiaceae bacterium]